MPIHKDLIRESMAATIKASSEMAKLERIASKLSLKLLETIDKLSKSNCESIVSDHPCILCGRSKDELTKHYSVRFRTINGIDMIICDGCYQVHNKSNPLWDISSSEADKKRRTAIFIAKKLAKFKTGKQNGIRK